MSHPHHPVVPSPESCMLLMLPLLDAIIPEASNSQQPKVRQSSLLGLLTILVLSRLVHVLSMSCPCLYPLHPSPAFFMSLDVSGKMWVAMWQLGSLGCVTRRYCEITEICGTSMCIVQMQPGFAASRRASRRHHGTELRSGNLPGSISPQNETAKLAQPGTTWHTP